MVVRVCSLDGGDSERFVNVYVIFPHALKGYIHNISYEMCNCHEYDQIKGIMADRTQWSQTRSWTEDPQITASGPNLQLFNYFSPASSRREGMAGWTIGAKAAIGALDEFW